MKNTVRIKYDCPLKSQLIQEKDGNFDCSQCQKKVHNFTQLDRNSFEQKIPEIENQSLCGMYRLDQIADTSNLNWKTRLNFKYEQWRQSSRLLMVPVLILGFLIVVTGCRVRHVAGKMSADGWDYHDQPTQNENTNSPTEK